MLTKFKWADGYEDEREMDPAVDKCMVPICGRVDRCGKPWGPDDFVPLTWRDMYAVFERNGDGVFVEEVEQEPPC